MSSFDAIDLGVPLAQEELVAPAKSCQFGWSYAKDSFWPVPIARVAERSSALHDGEGKVIGKYYAQFSAYVDLLVAGQTYKLFAEVEVPPEWFVEAPVDAHRLEMAGNIDLNGRYESWYDPTRGTMIPQAEDVYALVDYLRIEKSTNRWSAATQPASQPAELPKSAAVFVMIAMGLMESLPANCPIEWLGWKQYEGLIELTDGLAGITEEGFELKIDKRRSRTFVLGRTQLLVKNLGGRRIRIEYIESGVVIPTSAAAFMVH